jgi:hypothetical protein
MNDFPPPADAPDVTPDEVNPAVDPLTTDLDAPVDPAPVDPSAPPAEGPGGTPPEMPQEDAPEAKNVSTPSSSVLIPDDANDPTGRYARSGDIGPLEGSSDAFHEGQERGYIGSDSSD